MNQLPSHERAARSVFVGNIPYEATEEQLKEIFSQVGPVVSFRLVYDRETGKPKGYGFCEYQDLETAQSAMRNLNNHDFNGRPLRVGVAAGEQSKDENRNLQQALGGPAAESPFGDPVEPGKAPEAISKAVASLPPEQMFELMKQMKLCIQNNPNEARNMLLQNPQLAYALLQAQIVMKIVDPQVALAMLHRQSDQIPPLLPSDDSPTKTQPGPSQQSNLHGDVDHRIGGPMGGGAPAAGVAPAPVVPPASIGLPSSLGLGGAGLMPNSSVMSSSGRPPVPMDLPASVTSSLLRTAMEQDFGGPGGMLGRAMNPGMMGDRPGGPGPGGMEGPMHGGGGNLGPRPPFMGDSRVAGVRSDMGGPPQMPGRPMGMGGPPGPRMDMDRRMDLGPQAMDMMRQGRPGPGGPRGGRTDMMDPMHPDMRELRDMRDMRPMPGGPRGGPAGMNPPPRQQGPPVSESQGPPGGPVTQQDHEKAALIMQVLQLSDEQIAMLPPDQRQSILILKEQISRNAGPGTG